MNMLFVLFLLNITLKLGVTSIAVKMDIQIVTIHYSC